MNTEHISLKKPFTFLENGSMEPLSADKKLKYAFQANSYLSQLGGEHTFQPPPFNLHASIMSGHSIVATPAGSEAFGGFVKLSPWILQPDGKGKMAESPNDFQDLANGQTSPQCIEVGSLVVEPASQGKNLGKALVDHAVKVATKKYPNCPIVAVVTNDNTASLKVFNRLGWIVTTNEELQKPDELGFDLLYGWDQPSTIFIYPGHEPEVS